MSASRQLKPDYEKLVKSFEKDFGWTRQRRTNKMMVVCSCGSHKVFVAFTPSSQKTLKNTEAAFKRAQRECERENEGSQDE